MQFLAVGVLSGTSCDGIDLCLCRVERGRGWEVSPLRGTTRSFSPSERQLLADAMADTAGQTRVGRAHVALGRAIAAAVLEFLRGAGVSAADIDFVASHVRGPPKRVSPPLIRRAAGRRATPPGTTPR